MRLSRIALSSLVLVLVPSLALAGELDTGLDEDPLVYGGTPVGECGWPTAVAVTSGGGLCTGTLVHPQVVIYAAHCGGGNKTIRFSSSAYSGGNAVGTQYCQTNPGYSGNANDQGNDWAFCVLDQPVTDVPITPPLYGCELDALQPEAEIAVVGFGANTPNGGSGTKRWAMTTLHFANLGSNEAVSGAGDLPSICPGDSGGPAFIKHTDGVWHVFGIASTVSGECGAEGTHSIVAGAVPWVEESTGVDITPCHDVDGSWNPSAACGGFFGSGEQQFGSWGNWCAGTPASPLLSNCGPAHGDPSEDNPPDIAWVEPTDDIGVTPEDPVDLEVTASDDTYVNDVKLFINGDEIATDTSDPYRWEGLAFPIGEYDVYAIAEDYYGNTAQTETITIWVNEDGEAGDGDGDGDGDGTGDGDGDGDGDGIGGTDDLGESGDDEGCGCTTGEPAGGLMWLLAGLGLLGITRRRGR